MAQTLRLLHTADWHLGKKLEHFSRLQEQEKVLEELIQLADEHNVHAVLIAGDIFDSPNPPHEAKQLFTRSLRKLAKDGERLVLAIGGNHDSPELLDALAEWGVSLGVLLVGMSDPEKWELPTRQKDKPTITVGKGLTVKKVTSSLIEVEGEGWPFSCRFLLAPYLSLGRRLAHGVCEDPSSAQAYWAARWGECSSALHDSVPTVLLAHPYLTSSAQQVEIEEDEAERSLLSLGGVEGIPLEVFPKELAYAALGHIHRSQIVRKEPYPVAYAGSLLQYSFGDKAAKKTAFLVEVPQSGPASVKAIPENGFSGGYRLYSLSVRSLEEAEKVLEAHEEAYIELLWEGQQALPWEARHSLQEKHPRLIRILLAHTVFSSAYLAEAETLAHAEDPSSLLSNLFREYYKQRKGQEPHERIMELFQNVLEEAISQTKNLQDYESHQA